MLMPNTLDVTARCGRQSRLHNFREEKIAISSVNEALTNVECKAVHVHEFPMDARNENQFRSESRIIPHKGRETT